MPAKNKRRPTEVEDFAAHVEASQRAYEWAGKAIALRKAGKATQAIEAERRAKHWLKKTLAIEMRHPKPERPDRAN